MYVCTLTRHYFFSVLVVCMYVSRTGEKILSEHTPLHPFIPFTAATPKPYSLSYVPCLAHMTPKSSSLLRAQQQARKNYQRSHGG